MPRCRVAALPRCWAIGSQICVFSKIRTAPKGTCRVARADRSAACAARNCRSIAGLKPCSVASVIAVIRWPACAARQVGASQAADHGRVPVGSETRCSVLTCALRVLPSHPFWKFIRRAGDPIHRDNPERPCVPWPPYSGDDHVLDPGEPSASGAAGGPLGRVTASACQRGYRPCVTVATAGRQAHPVVISGRSPSKAR
jgi:hypothetical protein